MNIDSVPYLQPSERNYSIAEAKAILPMPGLLTRLGHGNKATKLCLCPLHDETSPSFGIYKSAKGEWKWKCFSGCGQGDEIDFLQKAWNISRSDAVKRYLEMAKS